MKRVIYYWRMGHTMYLKVPQKEKGTFHRTLMRSKAGAVFTAVLFLLSAAGYSSGGAATPDFSHSGNVQEKLIKMISGGEPWDEYEIIVQFSGSVRKSDVDLMRALGFKVHHTFHALPAVYATGTGASISALAKNPRVYYIEWNEPLQFFNEVSTEALKSTWAWDRIIGEEQAVRGSGITGKGVTVVVVDTGVDAGHPDLDYGEKTLLNLKSDGGYGPWVEMENTDTTGGHGTHVAGIVASNGDVSAGSRRGSAPEANLIGLSVGEGGAIINALGAFEWAFDNSRPGNNPYNIRVVTNSWGSSGGEYDPKSAITRLTNRLVYENNVVVTFAAGNSGAKDHDGHTITTNPYANVPAAVNVAATSRDHTYVAWFSSRGDRNKTQTYPDIATPGFYIMSTKARTPRSLRGIIESPKADFYAQQMSGTSMATPHCAGVVALLWQAAPSMRTSNVHQDFLIPDPKDPSRQVAWYNSSETRIHEAELILKLTADYKEWEPKPKDKWGYDDNGVPRNVTVPVGLDGRRLDWAQGYGFVNVDRAVSLALTLEKLRQSHPEATVWDALKVYNSTRHEGMVFSETNAVETRWHAEYTTLSDKGLNKIPEENNEFANQTKLVYIPKGVSRIEISLDYDNYPLKNPVVANLDIAVDTDGAFSDQTFEYSPRTPPNRGHKVYTLLLDQPPFQGKTGRVWGFNVVGEVAGSPDMDGYWDIRIEYDVGVRMVFENLANPVSIDWKDTHSYYAQLRHSVPEASYNGGSVGLILRHYDLSDVDMPKETGLMVLHTQIPWLFLFLMGAFAAVLASLFSYLKGVKDSSVGKR